MSVDQRVKDIAEATGDDETTILRRGLESYLQQELREVSLRIDELKETYDVENPADLEASIERGEIEAHPAWEAVIEWENLETRAATLERLSNDIER